MVSLPFTVPCSGGKSIQVSFCFLPPSPKKCSKTNGMSIRLVVPPPDKASLAYFFLFRSSLLQIHLLLLILIRLQSSTDERRQHLNQCLIPHQCQTPQYWVCNHCFYICLLVLFSGRYLLHASIQTIHSQQSNAAI